MEDILYTVWLSTLPGMSADRKLELSRAFGGPKGVYGTAAEELRELFSRNNILSTHDAFLKKLCRKDLSLAEYCLNEAEKTGAAVVTLQSDAYPPLLKGIKDPPLALFCLGDAALLKSRCVAVVGTRRA
ncbi:MAG: DNA-processing protein DprA, partial [Firmicutes bacterium]|nr:DNA-processing protein DprA [Bacillota bacterium]